jgi:hypothetical protein
VLALVGDLDGILEVLSDEWHPERVAGHQRDRADLAGGDADVKLARVGADAALVDDAHGHSVGDGGTGR